tara:strand:- start:151 stop:474 length:324 start_codon:yes stop_codon:yes gene_type:complete
VSNKKLSINTSDWEMDWTQSMGSGVNVRPQCEDYEYQFDVGDLVKLAPGFKQGGLQPGDIGMVTKRIVMYCNQVKSDGPAYKIAWQKDQAQATDIREFKLVPAMKRS